LNSGSSALYLSIICRNEYDQAQIAKRK